MRQRCEEKEEESCNHLNRARTNNMVDETKSDMAQSQASLSEWEKVGAQWVVTE